MRQDQLTEPQSALRRTATAERRPPRSLSRRERLLRRGVLLPLGIAALAYVALLGWNVAQLAQSTALAPTQDAAQRGLAVPGMQMPFVGEIALAAIMLALVIMCAMLLPGALRPARAALATTAAPSSLAAMRPASVARPEVSSAASPSAPATPPATPIAADAATSPRPAGAAPAHSTAAATAPSLKRIAVASPTADDTASPSTPEQPTPTRPARNDPRVFISHSSADHEFGLELERRLKRALGDETAVFYDHDGGPSGLIGGDEWQKRIERELVSRNVFVVILSPKALESPWVEKEIRLALSYAIGSRSVFVPLLQQAVEQIPPFIATYQYVSFLPAVSDEVAFVELLKAVRLSESRLRELDTPLATRIGPPYDLGQLPSLDHFVGREDEIAAVMKLLVRGPSAASGLASIAAANGLGGIGKSTLAAAVLRRLFVEGRFPDGLAVVKCNNQTDPSTVLRLALARFGVQGDEVEKADLAKLGSIAEATFKPEGVKPKDALIVLDNVEPNWHIEKVVLPLRVAGVALLLTSRPVLPASAIPEEANVKLDLLKREQALELFARSYGRPAFDDMTRPERTAATRIVETLGDHTLAVKLAGVYARKRPPGTLDAVADELKASSRLQLGLKDGSEAVAAVVDASYGSLTSEARRLFIALAAFNSTDIGRKAVLSIPEQLGDEDGPDSLDAMIELRLVDTDALPDMPRESDFERIRLHPLVATDIRERFKQLDEDVRQAVEVAVATWYARYANAAPDEALGPDEENIARAIELAHQMGEDALLVALCEGMHSYFRDRSRNTVRQRYLPWGLEAAQRSAEASNERQDWIALARLQLNYGDLLFTLGHVQEAEEYYNRSIALNREWGNRRGESAAITSLGRLFVQRGDLDAAQHLYEQAIEIDRELGSLRDEGIDIADLGDIQQRRGDLAGAQANYERYLAIMREVGDARGTGAALASLGSILVKRGDLAGAQESYEQSLAIMRELGAAREVGAAYTALGHIALLRGDLDAAQHLYEQAIEIDREIGSLRDEAVDLGDLGDILMERGDLAGAQTNYERALAIMQSVGDAREEGAALAKLAQIAQLRGDIDVAERYFTESLAIRRKVNDRDGEGLMLAQLAVIASGRGRLDEAEARYREALNILRDVQDARNYAAVAAVLGEFLIENKGERNEGCQLLAESAAVYQKMGLADRAASVRANAQRLGCETAADQ
ncbi:MAG TPA: tetratricopeptide repeat protein [Ktedonobacterales bacterium]